ncbi:hypothetical protein RJ639_013660 [Escallonia herrerae]|uniref:Protein CHUP1, chloroplastic n=1 Tax=Escallonia herrerae TaxID=1293975 RepID=A0AA88VK20_9ASTE|nr:hypothetical protein RJ639_013660 [Escallonia herrerae]
MKQEEQSPSPSTSKPEKTKSTTTTTGSRLLLPSTCTLPKPKNSSKTPEIVNGDGLWPSPKARAISTTTTTTIAAPNSARRRRSLSLNKSGQVMARAVPSVGVRSPSGRVVEQFARPTSQRLSGSTNSSRKTNEAGIDGRNKEVQDMLDQKHTLIRNLQADVLALKADLNKALSLNIELRSHNHKLSVDLAAAEAKIATLTAHNKIELVPEYETPQFRDIQKLAANKLEIGTVKNDVIQETSTKETPAADMQRNIIKCPSTLPPPPPPPPPSRPQVRAATAGTASAVVTLYHTLARHHGNKDLVVGGKYNKRTASSVHNSIVGEIQNRSAHLLAVRIKSDIETKQVLIDGLIKNVLSAAYTDIADVLKFVDWLDNELSSLADERAVLKHFDWPEKKADAMREAAIEYRSLKLLETEVLSYKDDVDVPCAVALKKMASLLDKSERSIHRLIKLRSSVMVSYCDHKIPTDWMLDSGIITKMKQASIMLAKMYMKRVVLELESIQYSERESTQEALLRQGVQFASRAHQFSGGLDSETLCAFEDIKKHVPGHLQGSQELFAAIPST